MSSESDSKELLILRAEATKPKIINLFERMKNDKKLTASFVRNPWRVLESIGELPQGHGVSQSNRLLFSLLSNQKFMKWANDFNSKILRDIKNKPPLESLQLEKIYGDFTKAIAEFADESLMYSLFGDYNVLLDQLRERDDNELFAAGCIRVILWVWVFVLPVVVVIVEPTASTSQFLGRDDLAQVVDALSARLVEQAKKVRKTGKLDDPSASIG